MRRTRVSLRQELPLLVWLVVVWCALWQNFSLGNMAFGALIAVAVARLFYLPPVELGGRFNLWQALLFLLRFLGRIAVASVQVFYLALARGPAVRNAVVAVPLRSHSDLLVTATGHVVSLIPGSLVVDVDRTSSTIYLHALNIKTPAQLEALRRDVRNLEAGLIRVMGSKDELAAVRRESRERGTP